MPRDVVDVPELHAPARLRAGEVAGGPPPRSADPLRELRACAARERELAQAARDLLAGDAETARLRIDVEGIPLTGPDTWPPGVMPRVNAYLLQRS